MAPRTPTGYDVPEDREFAAKPAGDTAGIAADDAAAAAADKTFDAYNSTTADKVNYYRAKAQKLANDNDCAVLCHFYLLPRFQRTPVTIAASLIPSDPLKRTGRP